MLDIDWRGASCGLFHPAGSPRDPCWVYLDIRKRNNTRDREKMNMDSAVKLRDKSKKKKLQQKEKVVFVFFLFFFLPPAPFVAKCLIT